MSGYSVILTVHQVRDDGHLAEIVARVNDDALVGRTLVYRVSPKREARS